MCHTVCVVWTDSVTSPAFFCFSLETDGPFNQLRCIDVAVVDNQTCRNGLPDYVYWSEGMVCAGRPDTDNCLVSMFMLPLEICHQGWLDDGATENLGVGQKPKKLCYCLVEPSLTAKITCGFRLMLSIYIYIYIYHLFLSASRMKMPACWCATTSSRVSSGMQTAAKTHLPPAFTPNCAYTTGGSTIQWPTTVPPRRLLRPRDPDTRQKNMDKTCVCKKQREMSTSTKQQ